MRYAILLGPMLGLFALAACNGGGEEVELTPTPSPVVALPSPTPQTTPEPTPEPTPTPTPEPAVQRIAYRGTDGNIWIINADGSGQERLTDITAAGPHWSPDGSRIAFATCEPPIPPDFGPCTDRIYVMNADGSNLTLLVEDIPASHLHWSPDGARIVFTRADEEGLRHEIYVMNADGSNLTLLAEDILASDLHWSPDGLRIAFAYPCPPGGIYVINADGSGLTRLDVPAFHVHWSADGRRLAYLQFVEGPSIDCGLYRGVVAHLDANRIVRIVPDEEPTSSGKGPPIFSPTNPSLLAYGDGLIDLGTGQMQALPGTAVSWSPNGQHLLLVLETCEGAQVYDVDRGISVLEFDISLPVVYVPCWSPLTYLSAWSPDSRFLATFDRFFDQQLKKMRTSVLHIGNVTTGDDKAVSVSSTPLLQPQFSPDGQHLLFSDPDGIWLVSSDGSSRTLLVEGGSPAWQPQP